MTPQGNKRRRCSAGTIRGGAVIIIKNDNINTIDRQIHFHSLLFVFDICLFYFQENAGRWQEAFKSRVEIEKIYVK